MFKYGLYIYFVIALAGLTSCSSTSTSQTEEISLKADRSSIDDLRNQTPEAIKQENDFLALLLKDMAVVEKKPQDVRSRFSREVRRTRDSFNKEHRRERELYNRAEKTNRESFLKSLKDERKNFIAKKPSREDSSSFYQDQNLKRRNYFQDQTDKRKDFESKMTAARKDFNDDMSLKQKQFEDAYREYSKKYRDHLAQLKLQKQQAAEVKQPSNVRASAPSAVYPGQQEDLAEFDNLKSKKRIVLDAEGN